MRKLLLLVIFLIGVCNLRAQFSSNKLQLRFGYNIQNTGAKSLNHLIDAFNNARYPTIVSENLPSVNWPHGFVLGANYLFREDMIFYGVFKTRRQFIAAPYTGLPDYRQYLFRARTFEFGMVMPLRDDDFFSHYAGGGILLGVMGARTAFLPTDKFQGGGKMVGIDESGLFGLSFVYEAQFRLHRNFRIFLRPVAQFALNSPLRRLSEFFDPVVDADGNAVGYGPGEGDKYNKASFNGIGIEGGLLFLLPEL